MTCARIRAPAATFALALLAATSACGDRQLAPLPEVVLVVDTNLPVPLFSRLRIDLYAEDGTWFDSRAVVRVDRRDWPASFGVFAEDDGRDHLVWVRLRIFPDGGEFPYRGERFRRWDNVFASKDTGPEPRLIKDGSDVTPESYPSPLVSVDRLLAVRVGPTHTGKVHVLLHGACATTMAHLGTNGRPNFGESESCIDTEKTWSPIAEERLLPSSTTDPPTRVGTWLDDVPCPASDPSSPRVCIPGGATILGSQGDTGSAIGSDGSASPSVVRLFGVRSFVIDRFEISVRRFREAIARGYSGGRPTHGDARCTYSDQPGKTEDHPVNCIEWHAAREFCRFEGGDLPVESQWEHAASVAGFRDKSPFPWGVESPACEDAVFARDDGTRRETSVCKRVGAGPAPIGAGPRDVTPLGVHDLFGSVTEWARDCFASYRSAQWGTMPIVDPKCIDDGSTARSLRGVSWLTPALITSERFSSGAPSASGASPSNTAIGFRCVYERAP